MSAIGLLKQTSRPARAGQTEPIGLLAGSGRFPILFAEAARRQGLPVACVGIKYEVPDELRPLCDSFHVVGVAKLGRMIRTFRRLGVKRIVMAGKVTKNVMYTPWRMVQLCPDLRMLQWWYRGKRADNRDDSLLLSIIAEFERDGMTFASALDFCPELLVKDGILTRRAPTSAERNDIEFGWNLAKEMGRLDVGQSVAVKEKAALAVEAIEGTDRCIERAGTALPRRRLGPGQGGQAPAGHAVRRADDRRHDDRKPAQGTCPRPGHRGRQDDPARPARGGRPGGPLWVEHRGALTTTVALHVWSWRGSIMRRSLLSLRPLRGRV